MDHSYFLPVILILILGWLELRRREDLKETNAERKDLIEKIIKSATEYKDLSLRLVDEVKELYRPSYVTPAPNTNPDAYNKFVESISEPNAHDTELAELEALEEKLAQKESISEDEIKKLKHLEEMRG